MNKIENKLTNLISGIHKSVFTRPVKPAHVEYNNEQGNTQRKSHNTQDHASRPDWYQATHGSDS